MLQKTEYLYEFGPYVLDTAQHLLLRGYEPVTLTPKTLDLLIVLVENQGRLLSKSELMAAVWPNTFVEESNLTQQVSMIRRALGETAGEPRFIVTVPGKGYRFAAPVTQTLRTPSIAVPAATAPVAPAPAPPPAVRRPALKTLVLFAALAVLLGVVGLWILRQSVAQQTPRRLAVLPFQNLRHDAENDFLGFSLADSVITKLGHVRSLTVRPSSAVSPYKQQPVDIPAVARHLNVDIVLTGNYIRDGNDLRITSQLIDVTSNGVIWRETFDVRYEKLLTLQDSVAQEIIRGLKLTLTPSEVERLRPDKQIAPLAYEYYLRGVDLYSRDDYPMAVRMLDQATAMEPGYAPAWASLGRSYSATASFEFGGRDAYNNAQKAYEKALALDPGQTEAQIYMANLFTDTGKPERAVPLLRQALNSGPNNAEAHWELGYAYRFAGMLRESAAECERARSLDPGVKLNSSALNAYLYLGQYDRFLQSLPPGDDTPFILFYRGFGAYHKRKWDQATTAFEQAFQHRRTPQTIVGKALSDAIGNRKAAAVQLLREAEERMQQRDVRDAEAAYKFAQAYAVSDDKVSALRVLRRSIENGFFAYPYFQTDPLLDGIRTDPEFLRLLDSARTRHEAFRKTFF